MPRRILVANRGEIACRIMQTASRMGIDCVAVHATDDAGSAHVALANPAIDLGAEGPTAYLDVDALIKAAQETGCDAVHPGYGFLSESSAFVARLEAEGIGFAGPPSATIALLGDKVAARRLARSVDVPVIAGPEDPVTLEQARAFFASLPDGSAAMLKAVAGGGGRGIRPVETADALDRAFAASASEALSAFGDGALFIERLVRNARHVEVQVFGDGSGAVTHMWDRDCSVQRRNQKLIEIAPAPHLPDELRAEMRAAAQRIASEVRLRSLATVEFLVEPEDGRFSFLEANPRIQVEHTITEEITDLDLVQLQLRVLDGATLADLGLEDPLPAPSGHAIQLRLNAERVGRDGQVTPTTGRIRSLRPPTGPGLRFDTGLREEDEVTGRYDSLLAKLIVHGRGLNVEASLSFAARALNDCRIEGIETNAPLLADLLRAPELANGTLDTGFVGRLLEQRASRNTGDDGAARDAVIAPLSGLVSRVLVAEGDIVKPGDEIAIIEAMKMEYPVSAGVGGTVAELSVRDGDKVTADDPIARIAASDRSESAAAIRRPPEDRQDLNEWRQRLALTEDAARPEAIARRHDKGSRTARQNVDALCAPGSFQEFGALAVAAQRTRRDIAELRERMPADGLIAGIGALRGTEQRIAAFAYDETVAAGTQSLINHKKLRRLLDIAARDGLPVAGFVEGGGGRPGDVDDATRATGLDMTGFLQFARISTPRVTVVHGLCFAGNAVLAGTSDVVIATREASLGMAGPAMIDAAGMGNPAARDVGPARMHAETGTVDLLVPDEAAATQAAHRVIACLSGLYISVEAPDPVPLRQVLPADRRRAYDVTRVLDLIVDLGSLVALGQTYASAMTTAFARIDGRAVGIIANNPAHDAGAIGAAEARKATRFLRLCNRFRVPVLSLCDTPGFSVGTRTERTGLVRASGEMLNAAAELSVPLIAVVTRRAYGLGAMAMTGGSFHAPSLTLAWPSGEFGGMGPEGAVRLGYRRELMAETDPAARQALFDRLLAEVYANGKALRVAESLELDAIIDPAETRSWISAALSGDHRRS